MKKTTCYLATVVLAFFVIMSGGCSSNSSSGGANLTYTVTYDGNGNTSGTVPSDSGKYEQGQSIWVLGNTDLAKTGYSFSGWNTKADGTGTTYTQGQYLPVGAANVVLYAKWTVAASSSSLSGIVAAGAPVAGIVNVKGANGVETSSAIASDGTFSIDVSALTAPYVLYAQGTVNGKSASMYSAAVATGTINITPITDFILRYALAGTDPATAYSGWSSTQVSATALTAAETKVQEQLATVLAAAGLPATTDLMTDAFIADHAGMDLVLDTTSITYSGADALVTNLVTGSTYTDSVASPSGTAGLPLSDQAATTAALTDDAAIAALWQTITTLYLTQPSQTLVNAILAPLLASDFIDDGADKTQLLSDWSSGSRGPNAGMTFTSTLVKALLPAPAGYTKGYEVRVVIALDTMSMSMNTQMVYDGSNWRWYGNRAWTTYRIRPQAVMSVSSAGTTSFSTGLSLSMNDETYDNPDCVVKMYAYCKGVRSAIVTGPGLPASGLILTHQYPKNEFGIYNQTSFSNRYLMSDDTAIQAIPDNAEYAFKLYSQTADVVSLSDTPLTNGTSLNAKRPLMNSELTTAKFPSLTSPSTHALADAHIPGVQTVSWTAPTGMTVYHIYWNWSSSSSFYNEGADVPDGQTTATIDTMGFAGPAANTQTWLYISSHDIYDREFRIDWSFE